MANVRGLSDLKKDNQGPGGGRPPMPGGGGGGFPFPGMGGGGGPPKSEGKVKWITKDGTLRQELKNAGSSLVVVDFTASWCGPCKMIAPAFAELSEKYTDVLFFKIDVDQCPNTASEQGVRAMPTFQFFRNGSKIDEFSGASPDKLRATVDKHRSQGGSGGGGAPGGNWGGGGGGGYVLGRREDTPTSAPPQQPPQGAPLLGTSPQQTQQGEHPFVSSLQDMGFPKDKAEKAVQATGGLDLEAAMEWILNNSDDSKPSNEVPEHAVPSALREPPSAQVTPMETEETTTATATTSTTPAESAEKPAEEAQPRKILSPEEAAIIMEERLKEIRAKKLEHEKKAELERELNRRKSGQEMIEAKKKHEEQQMKIELEKKKREKAEEKLAKEKVRARIEQDKKERAARLAQQQGIPQETAPAPAPAAPTQAPAAHQHSAVKKEYTEALIQIRLPDGNVIKATFKPTDPIRTVHNHISMLLGTSRIALSTTFPRKVYNPNDPTLDTVTLAQAELVPTGTFIVTRAH